MIQFTRDATRAMTIGVADFGLPHDYKVISLHEENGKPVITFESDDDYPGKPRCFRSFTIQPKGTILSQYSIHEKLMSGFIGGQEMDLILVGHK